MHFIFVLLFISLVNANDFNEVINSKNFTGKVVLVTGSSSGMGEGIAKLFSVLGANVVVTGRNETRVKRVAQEAQQLSPHGLKPLEVIADLSKSNDLKRLINKTITRFGKLDVLVNNAGIWTVTPFASENFMQEYDKILNTDLRAVLQLTHLSVPYLEETNGSIVSISSVAGLAPNTFMLPYNIAKTSIMMMTKVLALELGPRVRVNAINPGTIDTPIQKGIKFDSFVKLVPLKRIGIPIDIAKAVAFLSSSDAQYITGANLVVDGGLRYNFPGDMNLIPKN